MIREKILAHLAEQGTIDVASLNDDTSLYDAGLTSFGSMQLMLALEEAFEIEFPESMLNRRTFSTIGNIETSIRSLLSEPAS